MVVGALVVVGTAVLVSGLTERDTPPDTPAPMPATPTAAQAVPPPGLGEILGRYVRTPATMTLVLVPEYLLVVMIVGALRG